MEDLDCYYKRGCREIIVKERDKMHLLSLHQQRYQQICTHMHNLMILIIIADNHIDIY